MYRLIGDDPALQRVTLEIEDTRVSMVTVVPDGLVLTTSDKTKLIFQDR
jgi:hypothetical protein